MGLWTVWLMWIMKRLEILEDYEKKGGKLIKFYSVETSNNVRIYTYIHTHTQSHCTNEVL